MKTRLYNIWCGMKCRCYNANHHTYSRYGARGIFVCDEWKTSFCAFRNWAEKHGYNDTLTIDRINPDGPYSPNNCRWVSWTEQSLQNELRCPLVQNKQGGPWGNRKAFSRLQLLEFRRGGFPSRRPPTCWHTRCAESMPFLGTRIGGGANLPVCSHQFTVILL